MSAASEKFRFSQSSLSVFTECRRKFWLRYVRRMEWPAPLTDQLDLWEKAIERGQLFHHWAQQDGLGLDVDKWALENEDELLVEWWKNYREQPPQELAVGEVYSEVQLSVPLGAHRLVAKFDRVVFAENGNAYILDWKTGRRRPKQAEYEVNWQTLVYRYVMVEAGAQLNGGQSVDAGGLALIYWHANFPGALKPIGYSAREHDEARGQLLAAMDLIRSLELSAEYFPPTEEIEKCRRCIYSALCERDGERAEDWDIDDDDLSWQELPEAEL